MSNDAESICEKNCAMAVAAESNLSGICDASQTLASLRLSQSRPGDAEEAMEKVWTVMGAGCSAAADSVGLYKREILERAEDRPGEGQGYEPSPQEIESASSLPSYEFRTGSVKLLMEIGSAKSLERAAIVLGSLLSESDEVAETFFLLGYCRMLQGDKASAKEYLRRSLKMLESVHGSMSEELNAIESFDDGGLGEEVEGIEERIEKVKEMLEEIGEEDEDGDDGLKDMETA